MINKPIQSICVYCGSADGLDPIYLEAAFNIGKFLAENAIRITYGAGKTGLMGALADGALAARGIVIGIVPDNLNLPQLIHSNLTELLIVPDIHQRKAKMSLLADAFIALPGGYGTFDELFETLTWSQIGLHQKPLVLLNTNGYYDALISMVKRARLDGFIYSEHLELFQSASTPKEALDKIRSFTLPKGLDRWVDR
jgi:uncharacterized protein (TIGR00730 family)